MMDHKRIATIADAIAQMPAFPDDDIMGEGYDSETDTYYQLSIHEFLDTTYLRDERMGLWWRAAVAAYNAMRPTHTGPVMAPIFNQPWCPFSEEHEPHVQCAECSR